jgi:hypothetical protein
LTPAYRFLSLSTFPTGAFLMRVFVLGESPRAEHLTELLRGGGHTVVDDAAAAEMLFVIQREPGESRVTRQETVDQLFRVAPQLSPGCVVCLVSIEPNIAWPIGMTHVVRTTLAFNAPQPCPVTRAHFPTLPGSSLEGLILGAREDAPEAGAALERAFSPLLPSGGPIRLANIYEAERDAVYRPYQA